MSTHISTTEAARKLGEWLARVKHTGEVFVLKKNGKSVATLGPAPASRTLPLRRLVELWSAAPRDPSFADDLEAVNAADRPPENPWR